VTSLNTYSRALSTCPLFSYEIFVPFKDKKIFANQGDWKFVKAAWTMELGS